MARASFGVSAGTQGTSHTPRPQAVSADQSYGDAVTRAKYICLGLFVVMVALHAKGN